MKLLSQYGTELHNFARKFVKYVKDASTAPQQRASGEQVASASSGSSRMVNFGKWIPSIDCEQYWSVPSDVITSLELHSVNDSVVLPKRNTLISFNDHAILVLGPSKENKEVDVIHPFCKSVISSVFDACASSLDPTVKAVCALSSHWECDHSSVNDPRKSDAFFCDHSVTPMLQCSLRAAPAS